MKSKMLKLLAIAAIAVGGALAVQSTTPEPASAASYWKERQNITGGYICWKILCNPARTLCCDIELI